MTKSIALRVMRMVAVLWVVSIATFSLVSLLPGDPVRSILGQQATPAQVAYLRGELGLDQSFVARYLDWIGGILTLDFGNTLIRPIQPVSDVIGSALPVTLQLAVMALVLGLIGGVALGSAAAYRPGSRLDRVITSGSFALISIPAFVMALVLIRLFVFDMDSVKMAALIVGAVASLWWAVTTVREGRSSGGLRPVTLVKTLVPVVVGLLVWLFVPAFPREGWVRPTDDLAGNLKHTTLPALTLALGLIPLYAQLLRTDMVQTLKQNFVTVSRAKGMPPRHIIFREALRPSMFSLVTVAGISFGNLVGGSVIVESIFGLPGLGRTLITSIQTKDYALVQIAVLVAAALFLLLNTLVDITYTFLDPRIRRARH